MTLIELWEYAELVIGRSPAIPLMTLSIPGTPRGERMRLAGRKGPLCRVLCCPTSGGTTVQVDARKVKKWVERELCK